MVLSEGFDFGYSLALAQLELEPEPRVCERSIVWEGTCVHLARFKQWCERAFAVTHKEKVKCCICVEIDFFFL